MNDNKKEELISINVFEYISIILTYCADLTVFLTMSPTDDPYPVLLDLADSISTIHWKNHCWIVSLAGRALGLFFCMLIFNSPLRINVKRLSMIKNMITDKMSRLSSSNDTDYYNYFQLKQELPELVNCRNFQTNHKLFSVIYACVLTHSLLTLKQIKALK